MKKNESIDAIVEIVNDFVRIKRGSLTKISETCQINRGDLTIDGISYLRAYKLIRLLYAICLNLTPKEFEAMMKSIYYGIIENSAKYDYLIMKS